MLNTPVNQPHYPHLNITNRTAYKTQGTVSKPVFLTYEDQSSKESLERELKYRIKDKKELHLILDLANDKNGKYNQEKGALLRDISSINSFASIDLTANDFVQILKLVTDKKGNIDKVSANVLKEFTKKVFSSKNNIDNIKDILNGIKNKDGSTDVNKASIVHSLLDNYEYSTNINDKFKPKFQELTHLLSEPDGEVNSLATKLYLQGDKKTYSQDQKQDLENSIKLCKLTNGYFDKTKLSILNRIYSETDYMFREISSKEVSNIFNFCINDQGEIDENYYGTALELIKYSNKGSFALLSDFKPYLNINRIAELNFRQKRDLLEKALKYGENTYSSTLTKHAKGKLLPKNNDSYMYMISKLSNLLGLNVRELSDKEKRTYFNAIDNIDSPNSAFYNANLNDTKLELNYSKENFIHDIQKMTKDLSSDDKRQVLGFYSFELVKSENGEFTINGFPNTIQKDTSNLSSKQYQAVKSIKPYVEKFVNKNHISIKGNIALEKELNEIISAFPEFYTIIGKKQHKTHDYTLDIHTLKVLQEIIKNPYYNSLSKSNKRTLKISALLHDISKEEYSIDNKHPIHSALDAYYLTSKLGYSYHSRLKIYQLIKNHDWLKKYSNKEQSAKDIAFELRQDDAFKMSSILTASDMKAVKKNNAFYNKHNEYFKKAASTIQNYVNELKKTSIHLPQTTLPKASEMQNSQFVKRETHDGITNTVLYVTPMTDLSKAGFKNISDVNDLNVLLHALDDKNQASMFQVLGNLDSEALLSTSYMTYSQRNFKVFRPQGFILKVASDDIHVAFYRDFGSGYKKTCDTLKREYLFKDNIHRSYISSLIKKKMNLSDSQYIKLFAEIENKPMEVLRKTHPKFEKVMREIFKEMEGRKRQGGRSYNEILVTRPQIQGVFCYNQDVKEMPKFLRKYAAEHDVPILKFCNAK